MIPIMRHTRARVGVAVMPKDAHPCAPLRTLDGPHPSLAALLEALADRVRRLVPDHRDPERFHADKSDLVAELRTLAREVEARPAVGRGTPSWVPPAATAIRGANAPEFASCEVVKGCNAATRGAPVAQHRK